MAPEYAADGLFSVKSDVFSFGIILLEIVSGRKNVGFYNEESALNLTGYVSTACSIPMLILLRSFVLVIHCFNFKKSTIYDFRLGSCGRRQED